jgi:4a-hydroxytetrahydrobiopterin dehydratase
LDGGGAPTGLTCVNSVSQFQPCYRRWYGLNVRQFSEKGGEHMLDPEVREQELRKLPDWTYQDNAIVRSFTFPDFVGAMVFVNRVADMAERAGHHPDIDIRYNQVRIALSTHSAGGVTAADISLARQIAALIPD